MNIYNNLIIYKNMIYRNNLSINNFIIWLFDSKPIKIRLNILNSK